jgi:uncharacterized protein (DUF486 family)
VPLVQYVWPVLLLIASNLFMTLAWYGHLKFTDWNLWLVIFASWGIALFEYTLQVPANRLGKEVFTVTQLKIIQEAITLVVFVLFAWVYFKEVPNWRTGLAVLLVLIAVAIIPRKDEVKAKPEVPVEQKEDAVNGRDGQ